MSNNETEKDVENSDEAEVSEKIGDTNFDRECMCSVLLAVLIPSIQDHHVRLSSCTTL